MTLSNIGSGQAASIMERKRRMIQEVTVTPKQLQVILSGNIYVEDAQAIRESLIGYIDQGNSSISIDLSDVDYIDGSGLGALALVNKQAQMKGGRVEIKGLRGRIKELFELTRLNKVFEII